MEENKFLLGKMCNILVNFNNEILTYKARIIYISPFYMTFIDKFKKIYSYNHNNIIEVQVLGENSYEESGHEKIE